MREKPTIKIKKKKPKQLRVGYNISQNDLNHKLNQAKKFIEKGLDIKVVCQIKGRQYYIVKESGVDVLQKLKEMFSDFKIVNSWNKDKNYYLFLTGK